MRDYETIRLPLRDPDGSMVHHTLKGEWLVGMGYSSNGVPSLGLYAEDKERERWGKGRWFIIRSASGKLVVYNNSALAEIDPTVRVFDSFEAMQPHVPPSIYDATAVKAGLKPREQVREVPLEGV